MRFWKVGLGTISDLSGRKVCFPLPSTPQGITRCGISEKFYPPVVYRLMTTLTTGCEDLLELRFLTSCRTVRSSGYTGLYEEEVTLLILNTNNTYKFIFTK